MPDIRPLGMGQGSHVDANTIEGTFSLGVDMDGYKMTAASVDESGYFLTIRWEKIHEDLGLADSM